MDNQADSAATRSQSISTLDLLLLARAEFQRYKQLASAGSMAMYESLNLYCELVDEATWREQFCCRVCGVECPIGGPDGTVCAQHCDDHDYQFQRGEGKHCRHCHAPEPEDWK